MAAARPERTKIAVVIVLSILFVAVGYLRFFHGKVAWLSRQAGEAGIPLGGVGSPPLLKDLPSESGAGSGGLAPPRTTLRNIFAPPRTASPEPAPPDKEQARQAAAAAEGGPGAEPGGTAGPGHVPKPLPALKLTGTITGGTRPLAFINGRSLGPGEEVEGMTVVSISRDQVRLDREGRTLLLNVVELSEGGKP